MMISNARLLLTTFLIILILYLPSFSFKPERTYKAISSDFEVIYREITLPLLDYQSAITFVKQQPEVDSTRIAVIGFSTRAYLSFDITAKRNYISAYIDRALMTPFTNLLDNLKNVFPDRKFLPHDGYPDDLLHINAAKKIYILLFSIVGENDNHTSSWMSKKVFDLLKCEKEFWIVSNAEHGVIKDPEYITYPEIFEKNFIFKLTL